MLCILLWFLIVICVLGGLVALFCFTRTFWKEGFTAAAPLLLLAGIFLLFGGLYFEGWLLFTGS